MGMFDYITCKYPLPVPGANELKYQTKDTPNQFLDNYQIREDGTLWLEEYDTEDHSERGKWIKEHPGEPVPEFDFWKSWVGCMTRINTRWRQITDFTGEIVFYTSWLNYETDGDQGWIEWSAYFVNGGLKNLNLIKNREVEKSK